MDPATRPDTRRDEGAAGLVAIVAAYLAVCGAALPWFLRRVGPDAVSYITVAMKYRDGQFTDAVNGFWSPLFSWLLAPFVRLGPPPEVIARCLQIAIGVAALAAIWWLCLRLDLPRSVGRFVTLGCVPAVAMYALSETGPDLLVATLLTVYVGVVAAEGFPRSLGEAAAAGAVGGLAYLAKAYAFPFFLLHFCVLACWHLARRWKDPGERCRVAVGWMAGLLVFAAVSGPWVAIVSRAYGRFTTGTSGAYQVGLVTAGSWRNPTRTHELAPPPNPTAVSAWEDPTAALKQGGLHARAATSAPPSDRQSMLVGVVTRVKRSLFSNIVQLAATVLRFSVLSPLILLGLACTVVMRSAGPLRDRAILLLGTLLIYPSGYLLIFLVPRYLWLMTFLLATSAGLLAMSPWWPTRPTERAWLTAGLLASFAAWPCWVVVRSWNTVLEETPAIAARLAPAIPPGMRIASDDEWGISNSIAYHLGCRYHGMTGSAIPTTEQAGKLADQQIGVFFVWGDPEQHAVLGPGRELPLPRTASRQPRVFLLGAHPGAVPVSTNEATP